jgi:hypothetical protein
MTETAHPLRGSAAFAGFSVDDLDAAVAELAGRGVRFLHDDSPPTGEAGVMRAGGPLIAWSTDPAGSVFAVIEQD